MVRPQHVTKSPGELRAEKEMTNLQFGYFPQTELLLPRRDEMYLAIDQFEHFSKGPRAIGEKLINEGFYMPNAGDHSVQTTGVNNYSRHSYLKNGNLNTMICSYAIGNEDGSFLNGHVMISGSTRNKEDQSKDVAMSIEGPFSNTSQLKNNQQVRMLYVPHLLGFERIDDLKQFFQDVDLSSIFDYDIVSQ